MGLSMGNSGLQTGWTPMYRREVFPREPGLVGKRLWFRYDGCVAVARLTFDKPLDHHSRRRCFAGRGLAGRRPSGATSPKRDCRLLDNGSVAGALRLRFRSGSPGDPGCFRGRSRSAAFCHRLGVLAHPLAATWNGGVAGGNRSVGSHSSLGRRRVFPAGIGPPRGHGGRSRHFGQ